MDTQPPTPPAKALSGVKGAAITTAQMVMNPKAFLDWRGWFLGLYSSSFTAFAGAITTWLSTNGIEGSLHDIPVIGPLVKDVGMSWKAALAQAVIHAVYAAAKYVSQTKGLPPGVSSTPFSFSKTDESPK